MSKLYPLHSCQIYIHFILSPLVGSGSPNNSDDEQKMNNFIEKGTVFFFSLVLFFSSPFDTLRLIFFNYNIIYSEDQKQKVFQDGNQ